MPVTTAIRNAILDKLFREVDFVPPDALWLSLHTGDPGNGGASELPNAEAYARVQVRGAAGAGIMAAAAGGATTNTVDVVFPEAGGDGWAQVTHVGFWDAQGVGAGTFVAGAALAAPKTAAAGVAIRIKAGDLDVTAT